jgi:DNA ligase-1
MSEKLNGIRAYWNGTGMISRLGNKIYAPDWFLEPLPKGIALDGELWIGRKMFQETMSIVRRQDYPEDWKKVKYMLFDTPSYTDVFEGRMKALSMLCKKGTNKVADHVWVVKQMLCEGLTNLMEELKSIEDVGGEGLMLRQAKSPYEGCRSETCLKVKSFEDAEATIVGYTDGAGNRKGMVGAFMVEGCDGKFKGKKFKVGTGQSHAELKDPPPIGTKITFRYVKTDLSNDGIPKPAAYVGLCLDR